MPAARSAAPAAFLTHLRPLMNTQDTHLRTSAHLNVRLAVQSGRAVATNGHTRRALGPSSEATGRLAPTLPVDCRHGSA